MKALLYGRFGPPAVLELREVPDPAPGAGEVLVRVRAAALNPKDVLERKGKYRVFTGNPPRRSGYDYAGDVVARGRGVTALHEGEAVYGSLNGFAAGACAELVCASAAACAPKPAGLSYEEAASLSLAGQTALQALVDLGRLRDGSEVLINGGSGGVGTLAIQLARVLGAGVTTLSSGGNRELCRSLGAGVALDYAADRPLDAVDAYDLIFDAYGNKSFDVARRALRPRGAYVTTVPSARIALDTARTLVTGRRARLVLFRSRRAQLERLSRLVGEGALRPVVDRVLPLERAAEAHAYLETRRARGKVVLTVSS